MLEHYGQCNPALFLRSELMSQKTMTFMQAAADFFGRKPGQTLLEFRNELKALTDDDRKEIKRGLELQGYHFAEEKEAVAA